MFKLMGKILINIFISIFENEKISTKTCIFRFGNNINICNMSYFCLYNIKIFGNKPI